jgi:hypothetical protein
MLTADTAPAAGDDRHPVLQHACHLHRSVVPGPTVPVG